MTARPSLLFALALASCGSPTAPPDGGNCLASTPAAKLYEDACPTGRCYLDHVPSDGF